MPSQDFVGQKIKEIRLQTDEEMEALGWDRPATAIVLENDMKIFASRDDEGNDKGTLFTTDAAGEGGYLFAQEVD